MLLGVVALGLLRYTAWRWVQAVQDTEGAGTDAKGICKRLGYAASGFAYLALGVFAASIALGWTSSLGSTGNNGNGTSGSTISMLDSTSGRIVLGIAGAIMISVALYFVYKAVQPKFMEKYDLATMSETQRTVALHAGRIGLSTCGVAFAIIGGFILASAVQGTSDGDVAGMSDALAAIAAQSYGKILLGITGFGLMCYAVHTVLTGIYRRFNIAT